MIDAASLFATAFAGFVGSLHCAGMCTPLAVLACAHPRSEPVPLTTNGRPPPPIARGLLAPLLYHGGRLTSYATLGACAGTLGNAIDLAGRLGGIQRAALYLTAGTMVLVGAAIVGRAVFGLAWQTGGNVSTRLASLWQRAGRKGPLLRPLSMGLLTGLLPCGYLWVFLLGAAGSGSSPIGALMMAAFWLGTLPSLTCAGTALARLLRPLLVRVPALAGILVMAAGFVMIVMHTDPGAKGTEENTQLPQCCHAP